MKKNTIESEINNFLEFWNCNKMMQFLSDIFPLFELYDVDETDDFVKNSVGEFDEKNVRLIRSVYILSRIAEFHSGKLCYINTKFKNLWKKLENIEAD